MAERVAWVDASAGASGDLLLGALVDAGVPVGVMAEAIEKVAAGDRLHEERVHRGGVAATCCRVEVEDLVGQRSWRDIERLLAGAGLHEDVRSLAHDVFARLAEAKSRLEGLPAEDVHFEDVGSSQAIAEVVGVCAGIVHLGIRRLVASPVAVGGGPGDAGARATPAVAELLRGVSTAAEPSDLELCTPIGAALLTALADDWGPQPEMTVSEVGVGAGWDPDGHDHLLRLSVGESRPESTERGAR